ncbi:hypothetical protein CDD82_2947 [Ophiocordyceps australis]|uniref:EDC4-like protein pdc1 beta-propeller domain-containing protein n=1 Tax=Ophiocordyceps australis TaxID=1399860 RepID=A0A2C5Z9R0_9HYPO|nr:hypothetical protein CDD82_2947 [Ophiocordyceps australis]
MDLPPAPTPPVNSNSGGPSASSLLNLLKFSGQYPQQQQQPQPQQQQQQQQHASPQNQAPLQKPPQHQHYPQQQQQQQQQQQNHQSRQGSFGQNPYQATRIHQPAPSSADPSGLLAALMRGAHEAEEPRQVSQPAAAQGAFAGSPSADTRSYLLNLLNRPKPESSRSNDPTPQSSGGAAGDMNAYFGHYHQQSRPYEPPLQNEPFTEGSAANTGPLAFLQSQDTSSSDMTNLYQQLMGSLNQQQTLIHDQGPQTSTAASSLRLLRTSQRSPAAVSNMQQPRTGSNHSSLTSPRQHALRSMNRTASLQSQQSLHQSAVPSQPTPDTQNVGGDGKESVAEAVSDLADKADRDAREALDRAERDVSHMAIGQENGISSAQALSMAGEQGPLAVAQDDEGHGKADTEAKAVAANASRDDSDTQHAHGTQAAQVVADSWESVDQEEIVVIEETEPPPVRVYNFPMKPWISIALHESAAAPPLFRDESIMDIARLKKEFDPADRNLYTASQTYMTYGMSKQGGLRVIRQDDGKDAKIFTDTKDRIFNVSMSVSPLDGDTLQREREAILGTGISGTVYWVQIKDGEKDRLEEAHLEQYGFALPPPSSPDSDNTGKSRVRASSIHPEFFAVGRGKSINLIWPAYVMQKNMFKNAHDRVVDTDKLFKQCSLKINMGKAGKDFCFSQDDSVVVSLDKAGRVRFWDVRDLTAAKEDSDARGAMPAQTSLEVREALMSLSSTPEGEKNTPTSVLLLDKLRPYQKRCALRYMIVGMKQNHCLQLWDLALGKPVQEFNLPQSSDSDALCSVMYHPPSGIIVIGHPTRNSIYFAHLSAPKYSLKGISQAEYMQRLVAHDSSIPQPESTAVISGVREYSFANRGVIRSLDILANPAMAQDSDEPTVFELYAMHSKGVACLLIKQCELGWTKENKVMDGVDAVKLGVVSVSKLKAPKTPEGSVANDHAQPPRIATRKDVLQPPLMASDGNRLDDEVTAPPKPRVEPKELETPAQSSKENHHERSERKARKKKGKDVDWVNGMEPSPRVAASKAEGSMRAGDAAATCGIPWGLLESTIAGMETRLTGAMSETLKYSLKSLQGRIDEGARARDENFDQRQIKLLDMVSEVLNENTQKVLESLIHSQFTELVIPAVGDHAKKAVKDVLCNNVQPSVQKEIQTAVPNALGRALRSADLVGPLSDRISASVVSAMQQEVVSALTQRLTAALSTLAAQSAQHTAAKIEQQLQGQMERLQAQHAADANKMDQLMACVGRLTDMVSNMASSHSLLQADLMKLRQQQQQQQQPQPETYNASGLQSGLAHLGMRPQAYGNVPPSTSNASAHHGSLAASNHGPAYMSSPHYIRAPQPVAGSHVSAPSDHMAPSNVSVLAGAFANQMSKNDAEADHDMMQQLQHIEKAIQDDRLQDAMLQWIQSGHEKEIFRRCLSAYPPNRFQNIPPLLLLVVIATLSKDLKPNPRLKQEIDWIEMAVRQFGDGLRSQECQGQSFVEVMKSATQTIGLLVARLKPLIASFSEGYPLDPFLANVDKGKMEWIVLSSEHILSFGSPRRYD